MPTEELERLVAERVELQALFDAGTDTAADINRVMVLNKAMDESFPALVQELVALRKQNALALEALEWAQRAIAEGIPPAKTFDDWEIALIQDGREKLRKALASMPGGSDD